MPKFYLMYSRESSATGKNMASYLGIECGKEPPDERVGHLIRWGTTVGMGTIPTNTVNYLRAVRIAVSKSETLSRWQKAGINVPRWSCDHNNLSFPLLGRMDHGSGGDGIALMLQEKDIKVSHRRGVGYDFWQEYIPKRVEYRAHCFGGDIIHVQKKMHREGYDGYNPVTWNHKTGSVFVSIDDVPIPVRSAATAVEAIGLHFGAADIILGEDNRTYFLEVNTAPALTATTLPKYGDRIAHYLGIDSYPGNDALDLQEILTQEVTDNGEVGFEREDEDRGGWS